ncbi:MAG: hypothetical protein MZU84_01275 [Sphingobacterium sp.]|nr:hypothetical protein [Sphingobacterium sp.]
MRLTSGDPRIPSRSPPPDSRGFAMSIPTIHDKSTRIPSSHQAHRCARDEPGIPLCPASAIPEGLTSGYLCSPCGRGPGSGVFVSPRSPDLHRLRSFPVHGPHGHLVTATARGAGSTGGSRFGVESPGRAHLPGGLCPALPFPSTSTPSPFSLIPALEVVALQRLFLATRGKSLDRSLVNAGTIAVGLGAAYAAAAVFLGYDNGVLSWKSRHRLFYFGPFPTAFYQLETREGQLVRGPGIPRRRGGLHPQPFRGDGSRHAGVLLHLGHARRIVQGEFVAETEADGGAVLLVDEVRGHRQREIRDGPVPSAVSRLPEDLPRKPERVEAFVRHAQFKLGETLFGEAAKTGKPIFSPQAEGDGRIASNGPEEFLRIRVPDGGSPPRGGCRDRRPRGRARFPAGIPSLKGGSTMRPWPFRRPADQQLLLVQEARETNASELRT